MYLLFFSVLRVILQKLFFFLFFSEQVFYIYSSNFPQPIKKKFLSQCSKCFLFISLLCMPLKFCFLEI